jgi:hypothetical protein
MKSSYSIMVDGQARQPDTLPLPQLLNLADSQQVTMQSGWQRIE